MISKQLPNFAQLPCRLCRHAIYAVLVFLGFYHAPGSADQSRVVYVYDGFKKPNHGLRGATAAKADLKTGALQFYVPVCTFVRPRQTEVRQFEIRKAVYGASGIKVMADLCNDIVPNGEQQEAYVAGYNAVMDPAIAKRLGQTWKILLEKQVREEFKRKPQGTLRAADITFEAPY